MPDGVLVVGDWKHHRFAKESAVVATAQMQRYRIACGGNAPGNFEISAAQWVDQPQLGSQIGLDFAHHRVVLPETLQIDRAAARRNLNPLVQHATLRRLPDNLNSSSRTGEARDALQQWAVGSE